MDSDRLGWLLYWTSQWGRVKKVRRLLEQGSPVNWKDNDGWTPLMIACDYNSEAVVRVLLEYKADINQQNDDGDTAAHRACRCGSVQCLQLLIATGQCNLGIINRKGRTLLAEAVYFGNLDIVKYLITKCSVDVNDPIPLMVSILTMAIDAGDVDLLTALNSKHGGVPLTEPTKGQTQTEEDKGGEDTVPPTEDQALTEEDKGGEDTVPPIEETDSQPQTEEDKDWKPQFDEAMEAGSVEVNTIPVLLMGPAGSGKTTLKKLLCDQESENEKRTSTTCLDSTVVVRPVRTFCIQAKPVSDSNTSKWELVESKDLITMLAQKIRDTKKPPLQDNTDTPLNTNTETPAHSHPDTDSVHEAPESTPVDQGDSAVTDPTSHSNNEDTVADSDVRHAVDSVIAHIESSFGDVEMDCKQNQFATLTIRLTDTGGQRQFHDIAPLFTQQASVGLFVSRLIDDLDSFPSDEFYVEGVCVGQPSTSHLSHKETLEGLLCAFASHSTQEQKYMFIGTHRDKVEEQIASNQSEFKNIDEFLKSKNERLLRVIPQDLKKRIFSKDPKLTHVIVDINARNRQNVETQSNTQKIRTAIEKSDPHTVDVPLRWFVLELSLQELCLKLGRGVLTKEECSSVAEGIEGFNDPSMLEAALKYFSKVYIAHYYPEILPNLVFVDPQIPLDILSTLTKKAIELRNAEKLEQPQSELFIEMKWKEFRDKGIFTPSMLRDLAMNTPGGGKRYFHKGIFAPENMMEIMKKLLIAESLKESKQRSCENELFMPSLLTSLPASMLNKYRVFDSNHHVLINFADSCIRCGAFCCLVVSLIKKWSASFDKLALCHRNCIEIDHPDWPIQIMLIDSFHYIEIHCIPPPEMKNAGMKQIFTEINQDITEGIRSAYKTLHYEQPDLEIGIFCPLSVQGTDSHFAKLLKGGYCRCSKHGNQQILSGASQAPPQPQPMTKPGIEQLFVERQGLTSNDIDHECSDDHLLKLSHNLSDWELVARHLGLTDADINAIKHNVGLTIELKRYHALKKWKTNILLTGTATYRLLLRALLESKCTELAIQVCKLTKPDH